MVRKFKPDIKSEDNFSWGEYVTSYHAVMKEDEHGTYVKLETYLDEMARKDAQIARLHKMIDAYSDKLWEEIK